MLPPLKRPSLSLASKSTGYQKATPSHYRGLAVEHRQARSAEPGRSPRRGGLFQHLVLECHAFRIVLLEPLFRSIHIANTLMCSLSPTCLQSVRGWRVHDLYIGRSKKVSVQPTCAVVGRACVACHRRACFHRRRSRNTKTVTRVTLQRASVTASGAKRTFDEAAKSGGSSLCSLGAASGDHHGHNRGDLQSGVVSGSPGARLADNCDWLGCLLRERTVEPEGRTSYH